MTRPRDKAATAGAGVPVRLRLSRAKGFDLQAHSQAVNGLEAVKVARPGPFGNPFTIQGAADVFDCRKGSAHEYAVRWFGEWLAAADDSHGLTDLGEWQGTREQHRTIWSRMHELRGKNLACFCAPEFACHADVLLRLANATPPSQAPDATGGGL